MLLASGLFQMQPGPSCISVLWLGVGKELHTQSVQRLSSPQQTTCLLVSGEDHMFAAGEHPPVAHNFLQGSSEG